MRLFRIGPASLVRALLAPGLLVAALAAQANTIPGLDIRSTSCDSLSMLGRTGTYPTGRNGLAWSVSLCNTGSKTVTFQAPMNPDHPFFGFLLCRESNGRFEQISDRSYSKHTFGVANGSFCGNCQTVGSTTFGPNCTDTYSVSQNGDRFWLAPASEIDPWLGAWNPVGSHFDAGEPSVGSPMNADGARSLTILQTGNLDPVAHRVEVDDADLDDPTASYYYGAFLLTAGEAEGLREDSLVSRKVAPEWSGGLSSWIFLDQSAPVQGSILQNWSNSTLDSNSNGSDDGRFYVAVSFSGPSTSGMWHYEYAVHNRDNSRGAAAFRIPICDAARVLNAEVRDIDDNPSNDWGVTVGAGEIAFLEGAGNALEWNTIYNFSFDSDAVPVAGAVTLDQARPGPGAASILVNSQTPGRVFNAYLGAGCGGPELITTGNPPVASIPNPNFGLQVTGLQPGGTSVILLSNGEANVPFPGGCTFFLGGSVTLASAPLTADGGGSVSLPLAVPNIPTLEGNDLFCQGIEVVPSGPFLGQFNLTNGVKVRVGNNLVPCP